MDPSADKEIIDKICYYSDDVQVKLILKEYCRRLVLEKPKDPISFLIKTIEENPCKAK